MKTKILLLVVTSLLLISCSGGTPLPPFEYTDNSRIVVEGYLKNQNGNPISSQLVTLKFIRYEQVTVNYTVSDENGKFFISVPRANYNYILIFENRNIIGSGNYSNLLTLDPANIPLYYGFIGELNNQYYNFQNIILQ